MTTACPPYDDYPYYGRFMEDHAHAPYVIARNLKLLGLAGWTCTLLQWLCCYDGIEEHLCQALEPDPRLDPALCVRDVLLKHAAIWPQVAPGEVLTQGQQRQRIAAIIEDLLELDFVAASALWYGKERTAWNALQEDWLQFIQRGPVLAELRHMPADQGLLDVWIDPAGAGRNKSAIRQLLLPAPAVSAGLQG